MQALDKSLRRQLEGTVLKARDEAEKGARAALKRLAVGEAEPYPHLSPQERWLRNQLRARGRQLGDKLDERRRTQETTHLEHEVAYEAWHRLLFTRFLAENHLLMYEGVSVPLEEWDQLAAEEHLGIDGFELGAQYATRMLPQIFRTDDPVLQLEFAPEDRAVLKRLVLDLPVEVFHADDSLGWVYQFWQAKRKDEVNRSGVKIGADELPAVTQLFTEEYMVRFLLENTLGAWWMGRHPGKPVPVKMPYLRVLDDGTPAAGTFDGWPDRAAEITVMDPSMGSGHFLVAALHILAPMRIDEEGLSASEAVDAVLRDNLFGLELDPRCTQIAAFALALAAWTFPGAEGYRDLPSLNLACSGLAPEGRLIDWLKLAGEDERMKNGMRRLYFLFEKAPTLGSLIDPGTGSWTLETATFEELQPVLAEALRRENGWRDADTTERSVQAQGIAKAADLLAGKYTLVATNVPYLKRGSHDEALKKYLDDHYPVSKADLATAFVERCFDFSDKNASIAVVSPQNWLFFTTYKRFREQLIKSKSWNLLGRLGTGAFETISGEVVNIAVYVLSNNRPERGVHLAGIDASSANTPDDKAKALQINQVVRVSQSGQLSNPDARVLLLDMTHAELLEKYTDSYQGIKTGDDFRFKRKYWEVNSLALYKKCQSTVSETLDYGGLQDLIYWQQNGYDLARRQGVRAWGRRGVAVSQMGSLPVALHIGDVFDSNVSAVIPKEPEYFAAIWAYCKSQTYSELVRSIDRSLKVPNATLIKVPFDLKRWQSVAEEKYPNGLPAPYSDDPTQWIFHGHPVDATEPLQVAAARLVGYKWPAEQDPNMELSDKARTLVKQAAALDAFADEDGIVCIPSVAGEHAATDRLHDLLAAAYGDRWSGNTLRELVIATGFKRGDVETWLRDKFADQHNTLFQHRPFIWQIWDGHREGFSALVNYHKLDYKTLEKLTYTYLGLWIQDQQAAMADEVNGVEERLYAARELQKKLQRILEGEPPYDIFVRWKPLEEQPIGWNPDLNDGVRVNIRPFVRAGVLRKDPRVHWKKDRGKNPPDAPWGEERRNDLHLTVAEKRRAREKAGMPAS